MNSWKQRVQKFGGDGELDRAHSRPGLGRRPCVVSVLAAGMLVGLIGGIGSHVSAAPAERRVTVDPYRHVDWRKAGHEKGNLHTHTTQSDGRLPVAEVIDAYYDLGYRVLAITDHDRNTWPWNAFGRDPADLGMVAIPGNELSRHHHANSLFTTYTTTSTDLDASIRGVAEAQGLALLCHPAMHWPREHSLATAGVRIPLGTGVEKITRGDLTVEAWFRTTDPGRHVLLGNFSGAYQGALNLELHTDNRVRVYCQPRSGPTVDLNVSATPLAINTRDGHWHHLAAVRQHGGWRLFLDGRMVGQTEDTTATHPPSRVQPPVSDVEAANPRKHGPETTRADTNLGVHGATDGAFDLNGSAYYLGRDSRTGDTQLRGALGPVRLWSTGLSEADIAALARGARPDELAAPRDQLLAEYRMRTTGDRPLMVSARFGGPLDDTAGHPEGPFPAFVSGAEALAIIRDGPDPLSTPGGPQPALHFLELTGVPDSAVRYYRDLFLRHPVLFGMEVMNGTRPMREYPLDRALWDELLSLLMPERPVWGMATDDMHSLSHLGRDWAVFLCEPLDAASVKQALEGGGYYFCTTRVRPAGESETAPPRIERIDHDARSGLITLVATSEGQPLSEHACVWISHGTVVHTGWTLDYRAADVLAVDARYVRAEITSDGGTTYTNPYGFGSARLSQAP